MAAVIDRDLGWKKIKREMAEAGRIEVVVGILSDSKNSLHASIAEYAAHNEFGTQRIPSRPFMAISVDENKPDINADFKRQAEAITSGRRSAYQALTIIGEKHKARVQNTITGRDILPQLSPRTIAAKKGSTKTLVDTGAMVNAVQIEIRRRGK